MKVLSSTKYICAVSVVFLVATILVFSYEIVRIRNLAIETGIQEASLAQETKDLDSFVALSSTLSGLEEDNQKIESMFVRKDTMISFLEKVESLSSTTGARVKTDTLSNIEIKKSPFLAVDLSVQGSFSSVFHTLRLLEEMPYESEVKSLGLFSAGTTKGNPTPQWSAQVTMIVAILP